MGSVYKKLVREQENCPPQYSSTDPKTFRMNHHYPPSHPLPLSDRSNYIKPLSVHPTILPINSDFYSRVKHASDLILDKELPAQSVHKATQIVAEYNIPQTLEPQAGTLISGTCLGAGFYQEDPATGERTLMAGNMTYSFLPTCQLFYQGMNEGVCCERDAKKEDRPENKVRSTNLDPWMGHRETGLLIDTHSHASSEGPYPSPTSSSSLNSILNLGPLTAEDISAAQNQVNVHTISKSISPVLEDFINLDKFEDTTPIVDRSRSCSAVVHSEEIDKLGDSPKHVNSTDSDKDYEHIYGPAYPAAIEDTGILSVPYTGPICSAPNIIPSVFRTTDRNTLPRDDTPHPVSGKIVQQHLINREGSPPIEEPPFEGTGLELVAYYQILLAEQKRRNGEAFDSDEESEDMDYDDSSVECVMDHSEKLSDPKGEPAPFNNQDIVKAMFPDNKCIVCVCDGQRSSLPCGVPCKEYKSFTKDDIFNQGSKEPDPAINIAQGGKEPDPPIDIANRRLLLGKCCIYSPHPGQNAAFEHLTREVKDNAFTKVFIDGNDMYNYLYRRGGGALIVKEATSLRNRILQLINNLVDDVIENGWKTQYGEIREFCYRNSAEGDDYRLDPHFILPGGYRFQPDNPINNPTPNPFLFPTEQLCLRIVRELFLAHKCLTTVNRIDYVINITSPYEDNIRRWLRHGVLSLDNLLRFPETTYAATSIVEIETE
jgi:hypothetical protein